MKICQNAGPAGEPSYPAAWHYSVLIGGGAGHDAHETIIENYRHTLFRAKQCWVSSDW